ncbi:hypothetical protein JCM11641_006615 [Rhodosporidiobolus odoratus]
MVILIPLSSTASAEDVAVLYHDFKVRRFGFQDSLVSDRDPKFMSRFWRALHSRTHTTLRLSSSARPQTDGRSEVTNKIVGQILRTLCKDDVEGWASLLPTAEIAINSASSSATSLAPYEVVYEFLPTSWPTSAWSEPTSDADVADVVDQAHRGWLRCTNALIASRVAMVHQANKGRREEADHFNVGDKAYVATAGMCFPHSLSSKFLPRFVGPFPIVAVDTRKSTVDIAFPQHLRIHPRVHFSKLRPHFPNDAVRCPSRYLSRPPPIVPAADASEEEYVVEKVVADRMRRGRREFRVRYLGYSPADDEFRPEDELAELAPAALAEYLAGLTARRAVRPRGQLSLRIRISSLFTVLARPRSTRKLPLSSASRRSPGIAFGTDASALLRCDAGNADKLRAMLERVNHRIEIHLRRTTKFSETELRRPRFVMTQVDMQAFLFFHSKQLVSTTRDRSAVIVLTGSGNASRQGFGGMGDLDEGSATVEIAAMPF